MKGWFVQRNGFSLVILIYKIYILNANIKQGASKSKLHPILKLYW